MQIKISSRIYTYSSVVAFATVENRRKNSSEKSHRGKLRFAKIKLRGRFLKFKRSLHQLQNFITFVSYSSVFAFMAPLEN